MKYLGKYFGYAFLSFWLLSIVAIYEGDNGGSIIAVLDFFLPLHRLFAGYPGEFLAMFLGANWVGIGGLLLLIPYWRKNK